MARADWLEAGAAVLAGGGAAALTIERLCTLTGRTKGSFYHHFKAMGGFEKALLGHWAEANADRVAEAEPERDALDHLALGLESGLETAVRRWAAVNVDARQAVLKVDELRVAFLASLIAGSRPALTAGQAADLARLEYAAFLGLMDLVQDAEELSRLMALLRLSLEKA